MKVIFTGCGDMIAQPDSENDTPIEIPGECPACIIERERTMKRLRDDMAEVVKQLETKLFGGPLDK